MFKKYIIAISKFKNSIVSQVCHLVRNQLIKRIRFLNNSAAFLFSYVPALACQVFKSCTHKRVSIRRLIPAKGLIRKHNLASTATSIGHGKHSTPPHKYTTLVLLLVLPATTAATIRSRDFFSFLFNYLSTIS
jgi:hypothetical protein